MEEGERNVALAENLLLALTLTLLKLCLCFSVRVGVLALLTNPSSTRSPEFRLTELASRHKRELTKVSLVRKQMKHFFFKVNQVS